MLQALEANVNFEEYSIYPESYDPNPLNKNLGLGKEDQNGTFATGDPAETFVLKFIKDTDSQSSSQEFQTAKLMKVNGLKPQNP